MTKSKDLQEFKPVPGTGSVVVWLAAMRRTLPFYVLAVATVAAAAFLRWMLGDVLGPTNYPFFLFNLAVVICAWYGTLGSSLFCAVLGGLVADYLFVDPKFTVGPTSLKAWIAMITFLVVSIAIVVFAEAYRRAIRRSERTASRLKVALSVANASAFDWDPQTNALTWPDGYHGVFGPQGAPPRLEDWLSHVHADDRQRVMQSLAQIVTSPQDQLSLDFRIVGADGRQHWEHVRLAVLGGEESAAIRITGAVIDVTDIKKAESVLIRSEKLASAAKLAATVAHEVNNPLAAATNLLFLARTAAITDDVRSYLEAADQQLARVAAAAKRTLAFYKEHSSPAPVTIHDVLDNAVRGLANKMEAKKISLDAQYGPGLVVSGIAGELVQAFSNLISNSIDAAPLRGRIVVRASRARNWSNPAETVVRVSIADNGPGIKPADCEQLFEPFFSTKGAAGTGLGLWVTQNIVRRHAGRIRVRSRAQGNSTWTVFSITLPASIQTANSEHIRRQAAAGASRTRGSAAAS